MAGLHRAEPQLLVVGMNAGGSLGDASLGAVHGRVEENTHPFAPQLEQTFAIRPQAASLTRPVTLSVRSVERIRAVALGPVNRLRRDVKGRPRPRAEPAHLEDALDHGRCGLEAGALDVGHRSQGSQRVKRVSLRHE
jgi:hypothetical protein